MKIKPWLPLMVIVAGIFYSLFLLYQIPEGAYFSGDAGLKALLSQQLAQGKGRFDLAISSLPWVKHLWNSGLYPYQPPYVYSVGDRYFIGFPYSFPLVTAPFCRFWGYYGLYVLPLLGLWAIWGLFYGACRLLNYGESLTALGLGLLIFASPLTLYGAIYWEHSLAVALGFASLVLILWARQPGQSRLKAIGGGICLGLAVWFRPEFLGLLGLAIAIAIAQESLKLPLLKSVVDQHNILRTVRLIPHPRLFSLIALLTTILFFISNQVIYGHYLGMHGLQALEKVTLAQKFKTAIAGMAGMGLTFLVFMPMVGFILFYGLAWVSDRRRFKASGFLLSVYGLSGVLLGVVAFLVPPGTAGLIPGGKQWGTRFLLILVPILILATLESLQVILQDCRPWLKYAGIACFVGLLWLSFHKNTLEGMAYLRKSYQDIAPAIAFLQDQPDSAIAISHQFVGQVLQASVKQNKLWFRVENRDQLQKLAQALLQHNLTQFLYVCYPYAPCPLPQASRDRLGNPPLSVHFQALGQQGKYPIYRALLRPPS